MNTNKVEELIVEELINILNPDTLQCSRCKKWFNKDIYNYINSDYNYDFIKLYDVCNKCLNHTYMKTI